MYRAPRIKDGLEFYIKRNAKEKKKVGGIKIRIIAFLIPISFSNAGRAKKTMRLLELFDFLTQTSFGFRRRLHGRNHPGPRHSLRGPDPRLRLQQLRPRYRQRQAWWRRNGALAWKMEGMKIRLAILRKLKSGGRDRCRKYRRSFGSLLPRGASMGREGTWCRENWES